MWAVFESKWVRRARPVGAGLVLVFVLSACATTQSGSLGAEKLADATLVETKSSVQVMRNEAASRVPDIVVNDVAETSDASAACRSTDIDPDGFARHWQSSATIDLTNSQAARVETIATDLAASFVDQGWAIEEADTAKLLTQKTSLVQMSIDSIAKTATEHAHIAITITGPCVLTAGPDSEEVLKLEGAPVG